MGKTLIATALLRALACSGVRAVGMKPVAAGCASTAHGFRNGDVTALASASNVEAPIDLVKPYRFEPTIAPHLAAAQAGVTISLARIREAFVALSAMARWVVVEGAGGLLVPLNDREGFADLVALLELPVLLGTVPFGTRDAGLAASFLDLETL